MKTLLAFASAGLLAVGFAPRVAAHPASAVEPTHAASTSGERTAPARRGQIGATAGQEYGGGGLSVCATEAGARLHCAFQRLEAEATREGLWLTSAVTDAVNDRFRVMATSVGRQVRSRKRGASE